MYQNNLKKEMPGGFGGETGQDRKQGGKPELIQLCLMSKIKSQVIKTLLPWIASIITSLPYNNRTSRFLDRLIWISEGGVE